MRELATWFLVGLTLISRWAALHSVSEFTILVIVVVIFVVGKFTVVAVWIAILVSRL